MLPLHLPDRHCCAGKRLRGFVRHNEINGMAFGAAFFNASRGKLGVLTHRYRMKKRAF